MAVKKISNINDEFDPALLLVIARRNQLWIALILIVCAAAALIYNRYTHPIYESKSTIQLSTTTTTAELMQYDPKIFDNNLAKEIELIRSSVFLGRVASKMDLAISYFRQGNVLSFEQYRNAPYYVEAKAISSEIYDVPIYLNVKEGKATLTYETSRQRYTKTVPIGIWTKVPLVDSLKITITNPKEFKSGNANIINKDNIYFLLNNPENIVSNITRNLEVSILNEEAKTILIKVKDRNAIKSTDLANNISKEFLLFDVEKKSESASQTLSFLDTTINRLYENLATSEEALANFKIDNKIVDDKDDQVKEKTGYIEKIDELETQKVEAEFEISILERVEKEINKDKTDIYGLIAITAPAKTSSVVTDLLGDLYNLMLQRENLKISVTEQSPEIKNLDYKIAIQRNLVITSISSIKNSLIIRKAELAAKIGEYDNLILNKKLGYDAIEFARLSRQNQINEKYYNQLVIQKAELTVLKAGYVPQNLILDFAKEPKTPIFPDKKIIMLSGLLTWLFLSLGLILFRYLMHNQVTNIGDILKLTKTPILGFVPKFSEEIPVSQLIVDKKPKSLISEAFRSIRANLEFISATPGSKVIAITSTISGEGKTFVCINLGGIIAFSEKRVVLIDLDMRKPKIHQGFEAANDRGMSTILIGKDDVDDCIQSSQLKNLDFITAGPVPPNPSELILSKKMDEVLDYLKTKYDVVVIDNPPVGLVTDGIKMVSNADYPIYIFKANYSKKNFVLNVEKLINDNGVKHLSIILNNVESTKNNYGYGYSYGYNYGYGYGYGYGYLYGFGYYDEDKGTQVEEENLFKRILRKIIPS